MDISDLLAFSTKNNASDLHLSAGLPPMIRVDGDIRRINMPELEHKEVRAMIYDIMNDKPMGAWGIRALDVAIKCVMSGNERCLSKAGDVSGWLQALIEKPNGKGPHRYYSLVHLFAIRMKQSRFVDALTTADSGISLNPRNPRFELMQAHALIGLKRLDESENLLNDIAKSSAGRVSKYAARIKQLKGAIQVIRQKSLLNTTGDTPDY
jgi:hypothetical protein